MIEEMNIIRYSIFEYMVSYGINFVLVFILLSRRVYHTDSALMSQMLLTSEVSEILKKTWKFQKHFCFVSSFHLKGKGVIYS